MMCKVQGIVAFLLLVFRSGASIFPESPSSTTCTIGQSFNIDCRLPGSAVSGYWVFDGDKLLINRPPEGVAPTSVNDLYTLRITCTLERHYITVQCFAVLSGGRGEESSLPALIKVRGLPDQVQWMNSTSSHSTITLSWEGVQEPSLSDLTYCITIYNVTEGENRDPSVSVEHCMLRDTYFVFTYNQTSPLHKYEFVVTAQTMLGRGPPSLRICANFTFTDSDIAPSVLLTTSLVRTLTPSQAVLVTTMPILPDPSPTVMVTTMPDPRANGGLTWIVVAVVLGFLSTSVIATVVCFCLILSYTRSKSDAVEVEMTKCSAYESTVPCKDSAYESTVPCKDSAYESTVPCKDVTCKDLMKQKEFGSYESIEHIYADIR